MRAVGLLALLLPNHAMPQWESVGGGVRYGQVLDMLWSTDEQGLVVVGSMHHASEQFIEVNGTAFWHDGAWLPFGSGVNDASPGFTQAVDEVFQAVIYQNELTVVGLFDSIGGNPLAGHVARWHNGEWLGFDTVPTYAGNTYGLSVIGDELHLHGTFDTIAGVPAQNWAIWNGDHWRAGDTTGVFNWSTKEAIEYEGHLYVGGNFETQDGRNDLLMKVGDTWQELGPGLQGDCYVADLEVYDGLLWVAGYFFSAAGNAATGIMAWDGEHWLDPFPQMELYGWGRSLTISNGKLYMCGFMNMDGLTGTYQIAEYDGEHLCIRGGNQIVTPKVVASSDTLYAKTCIQLGCSEFGGAVVNGIMKMPLDWPADTCYTIAQQINEPERLGTLWFSPVPASDRLMVHGAPARSGRITVADALGRIALRANWRNEALDVRMLPSGTYQLTLWDARDRPIGAGRFVKQ